MKALFRINYTTRPGQSLWVRYSCLAEDGSGDEDVLPLRWLNNGQWQGFTELPGGRPRTLRYHYQLRREDNGSILDEWLVPRTLELDPAHLDTVALLDTWRSAGAPDFLWETRAVSNPRKSRAPFAAPATAATANHIFRLHMAAVPAGCTPCLLGDREEMGAWNAAKALPLRQIAENAWETALEMPVAEGAEYKYGLWNSRKRRCTELEDGPNRPLPPHSCGPRQFTRVCDETYRRPPEKGFRGAGVALPVFSLRSAESLGVGEFADLIPFADWAAEAGLRMIQILPVNDTSSHLDWRDSYPYAAISVFALHPVHLRIDDLPYRMPPAFRKELAAAKKALNPLPELDYEAVMAVKTRLSRAIYQEHRPKILADAGFLAFLEREAAWLPAYAAFCYLRDRFGTADFHLWGPWSTYKAPKISVLTDPAGADWPDLAYHAWLQYELDRQLSDAVAHLHQRGIVLKGDLPIGIDRCSVDAWTRPELYHSDRQAGAPPDAFAAEGQNWGFPTYNWEEMAKDGHAWWRARLSHLSRYFDAFRIDHILGFFRIWQIPADQVEGVMGWFEPALPIHADEIRALGVPFDFLRFCRPYIREESLTERFGELRAWATSEFLEPCGHGYWKPRDGVTGQRRVAERLAPEIAAGGERAERACTLRKALFDCLSDVLFHEVPGSGGTLFHPRCNLRETRSFRDLSGDARRLLGGLHDDYFYRRQEAFWEARGYERLPAMRHASTMLLCGEDLGMVPACVPGVMRELGFLSLEIQRMPKSAAAQHTDPARAPYASVVSTSTHDMPTLRGWWRENPDQARILAREMLDTPEPPEELSPELAERVIAAHFNSPAMWAVLPLQDLLAADSALRHPDPDAERINIPAIMPHYWRYRMHLEISQLAAAEPFNKLLAGLVREAGR